MKSIFTICSLAVLLIGCSSVPPPVAGTQGVGSIVMRYDVAPYGSVSNGRLFADVTAEKYAGLPDGFKVDPQGNIWSSGPAGMWVFSPDGKHLGTLNTPEVPANCNWGGDGKTLYITAQTSVYRLKLSVMGEKPLYQVYQ